QLFCAILGNRGFRRMPLAHLMRVGLATSWPHQEQRGAKSLIGVADELAMRQCLAQHLHSRVRDLRALNVQNLQTRESAHSRQPCISYVREAKVKGLQALECSQFPKSRIREVGEAKAQGMQAVKNG